MRSGRPTCDNTLKNSRDASARLWRQACGALQAGAGGRSAGATCRPSVPQMAMRRFIIWAAVGFLRARCRAWRAALALVRQLPSSLQGCAARAYRM